MKKILSFCLLFLALILVWPSSGLAISGRCVKYCNDTSSSSASYGNPYTYNAISSVASSFTSSFAQGWNRGQQAVRLNKLGNQYYEAGDYETALYYYEQARAISNNRVVNRSIKWAKGHIINKKGLKAYEREDWDEALVYFERAYVYIPNNDSIQHNLTEVRERISEARIAREKQRIEDTLVRLEDELNGFIQSEEETDPTGVGNAQFAMESRDLAFEAYSQYAYAAPASPHLVPGDITLFAPVEGELQLGGTDFFKVYGKKKYYNQSDYYKSLKIKDIPAPSTTSPLGLKQRAQAKSSARSTIEGLAIKATEKTRSGYNKVKEKIKSWTMSEAYDQTVGQYYLGQKAKKFYNRAGKIYKDLRSTDENIADLAFEGALEGSRRVAQPGGDGGYSEEYQKRLGELGDQTQKKVNEMVKDELEAGPL